MKLRKLFGIFPALFALVMIFEGCQADPVPPPVTPNTKNGNIYYAPADDVQYIVLSIYSTDESRKITPQAGNSYALAIATVGENGSFNYSGTPDSKGVISAGTGGKLSFDPDNSSQSKGIGSLNGDILIMDKLPGFPDYPQMSMELLKDAVITGDSPFPSVTIPDNSGGGGGGGGGGGNGIPPAKDGDYIPGRIVIEIEVVQPPNWASSTTAKSYWEGDPIILAGTGIKVKVTYNDGDTETFTDSQVAEKFIIDPPTYFHPLDKENYPHRLYWKTGFTNKDTATDTNNNAFKLMEKNIVNGPANKDIAGITSVVHVNPSNGELIEWFEDERVFNPSIAPGTIVKAYYGGVSSTAYKNFTLSEIYPVKINGLTLTVTLGSSDTDTIGAIDFKVKTIYKVGGIEINTLPTFKQQVLADDIRLIYNMPNTLQTVNAHWLNKLEGGKIDVTYDGSTRKKTITMLEAYNNNRYYENNAAPHSFISPPTEKFEKSIHAIGLRYFNKRTEGCRVPVFNTLVSISVTSRTNPLPIIDGDTAYQDTNTPLNQFLDQIIVNAAYESGKKGPQVKRTNTAVDVSGKNRSSDGTLTIGNSSTIFDPNNTTAIDSFFNAASDDWEKKGKPTKVTVYFKVNDLTKKDTIDVKAVGKFKAPNNNSGGGGAP